MKPPSAYASVTTPLAAGYLSDYGLDAGDEVEVELLVTAGMGGTGPRIVEGTVRGATTAVLVIDAGEARSTRPRTVRIPWPAIALIRDRVRNAHPAI